MSLKTRLTVVAAGVMLLAGCTDSSRTMYVTQTSEWAGDPFELDPTEVERDAPALFRLLEEAHDDGEAATSDPDEMDAIWEYLRERTGIYENNYLLGYKDGVFKIHLEISD